MRFTATNAPALIAPDASTPMRPRGGVGSVPGIVEAGNPRGEQQGGQIKNHTPAKREATRRR